MEALLNEFDILDPEFDIFQSRFLEASAGTGKTFAIEHLFIRLLMESKEPIDLPEILAVTFTREAAQEMKGRIRAKLLSLSCENNPRIERALALFDEAQIFTIHGFCHRILSQHAFEASFSMGSSSSELLGCLKEKRRTVEDFFQTGDPKFSEEITALIRHSRFDFDLLVDQILRAMEEKKAPKPLHFPQLPNISREDLAHDIELLLPRYKRLKLEVWQDQANAFWSFLETKSESALLKPLRWFFEEMTASNTKVRAKPLSDLHLKNRNFFEVLEKKMVPMLSTYRDKKERIRRVAAECVKSWEGKACRYDHVSFDDLLVQVESALNQKPFIEAVQKQYKVVIVDEFQDTDPIQWSIFRKLFLENHLLYLVGDPKQSIYGFRSADIYTYMSAAKSFGEGSKAYLSTNFRSSPSLVAALNKMFTARNDWIDLPSFPGVIKYRRVRAGRDSGVLSESPITYFGVKGPIGRERQFPTKSLEEELIFPYIAKEILRLNKMVAFDQIAILIKDRYHAQRLQLHLNLWKIPSIIKRAFNLSASRGFVEMEFFLKALDAPRHEAQAKLALRGNGESPFGALRDLFDEKGFAVCYRQYLEKDFQPHGDRVLRGEFMQTAELLMECGRRSPGELLAILENLKKETVETDPRLKVRSEEGEEGVAIMTPFASKGLEFLVVFALSAAYRRAEQLDEEQASEEMRQFYVACTRSREKLYVPYVVETSGKGSSLSPSQSERFFSAEPDFVDWIEPVEVEPYEDKRQVADIKPPPSFDFCFDTPFVTSFSSMAKNLPHTLLGQRFASQDFSKKTPHTLPLGVETGTVIHEAFERCFLDRDLSFDQIAFESLSGTHLEGWEETVSKILENALNLELLTGFCLKDLGSDDFFPEMEFLFPEENHFVKGFIDLIFKRGETFYVLDWKTNWVGPDAASYTSDALDAVMREHDYPLQASLYGDAVMRYVKRLYKTPQYGGAYYMFVRGNKVVHIGTR